MTDSHHLVLISETVLIGLWAGMHKVLEVVYGGFDLSKMFFMGFVSWYVFDSADYRQVW
jgi:hypothetical protein